MRASVSRATRARRRRQIAAATAVARQSSGRLQPITGGGVQDVDYGWQVRPWRAGGGYRSLIKWKVDADPFTALMALTNVVDVLLADLEGQLVQELRSMSFSWADIGAAMGVSGEAVRQVYGVPDAS